MTSMGKFQETVGASGPVCVRGGRTRWSVGRDESSGWTGEPIREVVAPVGIEAFEPEEMTVRVGAGTTLEELAAVLSAEGQEVALDGPGGSTIGGALMVGWSPLRRGTLGEATDTLLQADCVGADGALFTAGGPTVKNVTGYDLCRLLVGSLGTLALVGRVILRTRPIPESGRWLAGPIEPSVVRNLVHRPATLLWDGSQTMVFVEGHQVDVRDETSRLESLGMVVAESPVLPPWRDRWDGVLPPGAILEVGAGVIHCWELPPAPQVLPGITALSRRLRGTFDPDRRLNPQCDPHLVTA